MFHVGNAIRETGFDYLLKILTNRIAQLQRAAVPSFGAVASAASVTSTAPVASVGSIGGADLLDFRDLARAGDGSVNFVASTSNAPQFHGIRANDDEKEAAENEETFDADYFLPSDDSEDGKDSKDGEDDDGADSLGLDLEHLNIKTISDDLDQDLNHLNISDFGDFGDCELNKSDILACKFQFSVFFHILNFKIIYLLTCCGLFY